jgi:hypothetical protein
MRVDITDVAVTAWCMNGEVDGNPIPIGEVTGKGTH